MEITCFDVADYFLASQEIEDEDYISNLKLQKLCYYAQGFCLALTGQALFTEEIQAWSHGPVVPKLYRKYKEYNRQVLPIPQASFAEICRRFSKEQLEIINEVKVVYGQFSAWRLRDLTHQEPPWINAFNGSVHVEPVISQSALKAYFSTQIIDDNTF